MRIEIDTKLKYCTVGDLPVGTLFYLNGVVDSEHRHGVVFVKIANTHYIVPIHAVCANGAITESPINGVYNVPDGYAVCFNIVTNKIMQLHKDLPVIPLEQEEALKLRHKRVWDWEVQN